MRQLKITQKITDKEFSRLETYFQEVSKISLLEPEDEVKLVKQFKKGDKKALDRLVSANLRFVISVAKQYQYQGMSLPDLINEGNIGLIRAAKSFDETKGFKFISYAVWWIRQSILNSLATHNRLVRLPLNKTNELLKFYQTSEQLEQKLERVPNENELAREMETSVRKVRGLISIAEKQQSIDAPVHQGEDLRFIDILNNKESSDPDENLNWESLKKDITSVFSTLTPVESRVLSMYYGLYGQENKTLTEISEILNLSAGRVRQIKNQGIRKLRKSRLKKLLKPYLGK